MFTKQLNHTQSNKWLLAGIVALLVLAGCSGAPSQATQAPTQAVPVTGSTATVEPMSTPEKSATSSSGSDDIYGDQSPTKGASLSDDSAEVKIAQSAELGNYLVDENGMALYIFTKDAPGVTNCSGQCLANWPPFLTEKPPKGDDGVDESKLGTITLADGSLQVTYEDLPLYYWIGDKKPGDTTGQNVGEVWFVVDPAVGVTPFFGEGAKVEVAQNAALGSFLVDAKGMTLYLFTKDTPGVSNCSGQCLVNWPPFLTEKAPLAGNGVDAAKLGTITLADGTKQVTYDNLPLYYYIKDVNPGDTTGQNVGEVWFVVAP